MCKDREKMIERIRKLLAVTENRGATEAEAIAAALAAQKLMAENDVERWELEGNEEPIESVKAKKPRNWMIKLAVVVAENFRCKCYHSQSYEEGRRRRTSYACFFGYRHDAEAAKLVYERLADIGNKLASEWTKRRVQQLEAQGIYVKPVMVHNGYTSSFVDGVRSELEKQSMELIIVCPPKVNEAFGEFMDGISGTYKPVLKHYRDDSASRNAGYRAGRDAVRSGRLGEAHGAHLLTV